MMEPFMHVWNINIEYEHVNFKLGQARKTKHEDFSRDRKTTLHCVLISQTLTQKLFNISAQLILEE